MFKWSPGQKLSDVEKVCIEQAYRHFSQNKTKTAEALGISIRTLDTRLEEYAHAAHVAELPPQVDGTMDLSKLKAPFFPHREGHKEPAGRSMEAVPRNKPDVEIGQKVPESAKPMSVTNLSPKKK